MTVSKDRKTWGHRARRSDAEEGMLTPRHELRR